MTRLIGKQPCITFVTLGSLIQWAELRQWGRCNRDIAETIMLPHCQRSVRHRRSSGLVEVSTGGKQAQPQSLGLHRRAGPLERHLADNSSRNGRGLSIFDGKSALKRRSTILPLGSPHPPSAL
jgi:hypothetical protein